jgi:signal transduction histidine kinase/ActR/RegA family two-component response regulator
VRAEISYVRVTALPTGDMIEVARMAHRPATPAEARAVGAELEARLELRSPDVARIPHPAGADELTIAAVPIGSLGEQGCLVAGAARQDFPTAIERMLLGVCANQAAISLRHAQYIADLREAAQVKEKLLIELSESARGKDEFLAMLGHELRNPLASILSAAQVVRLRAAKGKDIGPTTNIVERQALHMARLIDDLLDVARVSQGKIVLRKELIDLASVVSRAVEAVRPLVEEGRHELVIALPGAPVVIEADLARLQQIISNLLSNAARYSDPGGTIWLSAAAEGATLVLRVRDRGMGMAKDLLPRVFELFVQADRSLSRSQGGLGIGLALVRNLVELHGGSVEAKSDGPGKGSEFVVRLPYAPQPALPDGAAVDGELERPAVGGGRRVVIIDDNVDAASCLAELLEGWGYSVRTAYDGMSGIEAALSYRPSLILLDIGLPDVNGYEVAGRLRRALRTESRIVAVTGYGQAVDRQRAREAGFDHHVVKPVNLDLLHSLLVPEDASKSTR